MAYVLQGGKVFCGGICSAMNLRVEHGQVTAFGPIVSISPEDRVFFKRSVYFSRFRRCSHTFAGTGFFL